ncbi:MAG: CRISPR-associated endonuclease Cas1 [Thermoplasmata archaeon]|nr:CRISPR-associated endonuclease Cas1 [Thermoplasmata archaeon]
MHPLLLHGFGTSVRVNGRKLEVDWRSEGRKEVFRPQQLPFDSVVIDSMTGSVSFEALRFLAIHDTPVTLLRWNGTVLSTILPRGPSNGELRVAQVTAYQSHERRLIIARGFIREKVAKTISLDEALARTLPMEPGAVRKEAGGSMGSSLNDLRIYEARVAQAHWKEYAKAVELLWPNSGFMSRRSPQKSWSMSAADPTNALLNYGYSILEASCRAAIDSVGLLPEIGFLHEVASAKMPLAYDLQEPFRWLVDLSVIEVIRDGKLDRKRDFIVTENYHVRLRPVASEALLGRLSANMNRKVPMHGRSFAFETLIQETARRLARHLTGAGSRPGRLDLSYPFAMGESGHVDGDLKARVGAMSYAEGRSLGISKAGLFAMKRRAAKGRPLRLYGKVRDRIV